MNKHNIKPIPVLRRRRNNRVFSYSLIPGSVLALDAITMIVSGFLLYASLVHKNPYIFDYYVFAILFVTAATIVIFQRADLYQVRAIMRPLARSDSILIGVATAFMFFLTITFSLKVSEMYSRIWLYSFAGVNLVSLLAMRMLVYRALKTLSRRNLIGRSMVVLGGGPQAKQFVERLNEANPFFTELLGIYDPQHSRHGQHFGGYPVLGGIDDLIAAARLGEIDDIVVAMPWNADREVIQAVERLKELPVNVLISSDLVGFQLAFRPMLGHFRQLPLFEVVQRPISGWSSVIKKIEDLILASACIILLSPLLITIAIAIKLDSPGPVLFRQPRLGFNNRRFDIYKFRSMYHEAVPEERVQQATREDPRVTRVGRFIRRTSIDELPQLFNVLQGSMSLVGPRPHALSHNAEFSEQVRGYFARHKVKPGITGWAQVHGFRGETDTIDKIRSRVEHDVYYAENWSLLLDIRILVMTGLVVLFQKSAY